MRTRVALLIGLLGIAGTAQCSDWLERNAAGREARDEARLAAMQRARDTLAADLGQAQRAQSDGERTNQQLRAAIIDANGAVEAARQQLAQATADLDDLMAAGRQFAGDLYGLRRRERIIHPDEALDAELSAITRANRPLYSAELARTWQLLVGQVKSVSGVRRLPPPSGSELALLQVGAFTAYNANGFYALNAADPVQLAAPGAPWPSDGSGRIAAVIDPSRGAAPEILANRGGLATRWRRIIDGSGVIGITITALGAIGFAIVLIQLPMLVAAKRRMHHVEAGRPGNSSALDRLMHAAQSPDGAALDRSLRREVARLERGQPLIGLLIAMAPLLGLLGTVTGLIVTFQTLSLFGGSDPALMAGGISRALTTTALGLVVAVPLALALALLRRLSRTCVRNLEVFARNLHIIGATDRASASANAS